MCSFQKCFLNDSNTSSNCSILRILKLHDKMMHCFYTKAYIVMYLILKKATEGLKWSFACMLRCSSHVWLCNPVNCSPPSSSVHGILQARILEWVATPSSRGSSRPKYQAHVSWGSCIADGFLFLPCGHLNTCNFNLRKV